MATAFRARVFTTDERTIDVLSFTLPYYDIDAAAAMAADQCFLLGVPEDHYEFISEDFCPHYTSR